MKTLCQRDTCTPMLIATLFAITKMWEQPKCPSMAIWVCLCVVCVCVCVCVYTCFICGGSDGKESACNAGDLGLIPGLGRSPGEGDGYLLQYFFFFQCYSSILSLQYSCLENSRDRGAWWATGSCNESDTTEWLTLSSIEKEGNSAIWDNMNGPWGHYAKGNTSDRKRQFMISIICGI